MVRMTHKRKLHRPFGRDGRQYRRDRGVPTDQVIYLTKRRAESEVMRPSFGGRRESSLVRRSSVFSLTSTWKPGPVSGLDCPVCAISNGPRGDLLVKTRSGTGPSGGGRAPMVGISVGGGVRINPDNARMSGRHGVQYVAQCVACAALTPVVWQ